jgi:tRNA threonylcarbamoyl adenosine modification protein YeaZ
LTKVLLAIDTSSGTAVAVLVDGVVASETYHPDTMQHAEQIGLQIRKVLDAANKKSSDVTDVAVGVGPGPFTGLRVGIAAAKMFAEGVGATIFGVCSLDAIAFTKDLSQPTLVLSDARRSEVFFGLYQGKSPAGAPITLLGPGVKKQSDLEAELQSSGQSYEIVSGSISAASLGLLALAQLAEGTADLSIVANYLRAPDAVPAKGKKVSG